MNQTVTARQAMRCGYLPREENPIDVLRAFPRAETCPAYTTQMPEVIEAARGLIWLNRNGISCLYPDGVTPLFVDSVDILDSAVKRHEREEIEKARSKGGG